MLQRFASPRRFRLFHQAPAFRMVLAIGRQFYELMLGSPRGSIARVEFLRAGVVRRVDVPVEQVDTAPRG